jgi:6-phosphogluconolactonase
MRIVFYFLLAIGTFKNIAIAQPAKNKTYNLIVGTYTNKSKTNGIHVYAFDNVSGNLAYRSQTLGLTDPSFLTVSPDNKKIYAVSEVGDGQATVSAFSFEPRQGNLMILNQVSAGGNGPCYISMDKAGTLVFVGNYGSGSLSATRVTAGGLLTEDTQVIQHYGASVDRVNQAKPHVHSVVLSPDQKYLFASDLGTDKVYTYRVDKNAKVPLVPGSVPFVDIKRGSGPRHFTFHPNGKYAYLILELNAEIAAFDYADGKLTPKQYITMLPKGFKKGVEAADIHVSPDGKFLYGSNRSDANDIVIYSILKDGKLKYAGRQSAGVETPRNFAIDPTGKFLLVANMTGNNVTVFERNTKSGLLTMTNKKVLVDSPVCLQFVAVN